MMDLFEFAAREQDPQARYRELCGIVKRNNELYYAKAEPEISDAEYDLLYRELKELEREHPDWVTTESPTQKVGNDLSEGFRKVQHPAPMQSIDDVFEHKPGEGETDAEAIIFYYDSLYLPLGGTAYEGRSRSNEGEKVAAILEHLQSLEQSRLELLPKVTVEPKIDGCAVTLLYRRGRLIYAATRGDGRTGDDITENVRGIAEIPFRLPEPAPELLELRGEIFMCAADFDRLNEERDAAGLQAFANPRNATAGSIKLLDPAEAARRPLRFLAHGLGVTEGVTLQTMDDYETLFQKLGLPYNRPIKRAASLTALRQAIREINTERQELGFGTDGAVIKLDDFALREALGATARAPRWAAAFKYLPEQKETLLKSISIQVGRTGVLTPVAELEPVRLSGTMVSRATLHNQDEIARKDICIGDTLLMEKSGEIIPNVVHVVKSKRPADAKPYNLYEAVGGLCPCCGAPIAREEGQVAWRCSNLTCPAQAAMRTGYFCKHEALDIESLGGTVAEALVQSKLIASPLDLFRLQAEELAQLNLGTEEEPRRFGEKNAAKALAALEKAKQLPLERWLTALGIPGIGSITAQSVAEYHSSMAALLQSPFLLALEQLEEKTETYNSLNPKAKSNKGADAEELESKRAELLAEMREQAAPYEERGYLRLEKNGPNKLKLLNPIGSVSLRNLLRYFRSAAGQHTWQILEDLGINPASPSFVENRRLQSSGPLSGKTFVLTGSLSRPRPEFAKMIVEAGGKAGSAVSKNTDYLLAGEGGGSKREKAVKLGVPIMSEAEFWALLKGGEA